MSIPDTAYETRELVMSRLGEDLLGGPDDDVLTEKPLSRFIMGILYPEVTTNEPGASASSGFVLEEDVENDVEAETGGQPPTPVSTLQWPCPVPATPDPWA